MTNQMQTFPITITTKALKEDSKTTKKDSVTQTQSNLCCSIKLDQDMMDTTLTMDIVK